MYRWIDQNGAITYSDQPPSDPSAVKALTVIDGPASPTAYEKRAKEIIDAEREKNPGESTALNREAQPSHATWGREAEMAPRDIGRAPESAPRAFGPGELPQAPRMNGRAMQPEAAQDPCLRSADPKCYERNRNAYVPYLGYAPSAARVRSETLYGTGAAGGITAGGAVGGSVGLPTSTVTPPRQPAVLQLRNSLKDARDLK